MVSPFYDAAPLVEAQSFDARYQSYAVAGIFISESISRAHTVNRSARHVRQGGTDQIVLRRFKRGRAVLGVGDMPVVLEPHVISLVDSRFEIDGHTSGTAHLGCRIPRERIETRLFDRVPALLWNSDSVEAKLVDNVLQNLWSGLASGRAAESRRLAAGLIGLINGLLSTHPDEPAQSAINWAMADAIQAFIERHLDDRSLTSDTLCQTFACSRARLYRLFRPYGGVERYIQNQRLERCFVRLSRTPASLVRIRRVATTWGFEDPSHFHRLFKKRFGIRPSDVSPPEPNPAKAGSKRVPPNAEITRFHHWFRRT